MKNNDFDPIHVLNGLLLVINCVFIVLLVTACSAKVNAHSYSSVASVAAPALPASGPAQPTTAPVPALTASEADFMAAMLAP